MFCSRSRYGRRGEACGLAAVGLAAGVGSGDGGRKEGPVDRRRCWLHAALDHNSAISKPMPIGRRAKEAHPPTQT